MRSAFIVSCTWRGQQLQTTTMSSLKKLPGQDLLSCFTKLSEGNETERIQATQFILKRLSHKSSSEKQANVYISLRLRS